MSDYLSEFFCFVLSDLERCTSVLLLIKFSPWEGVDIPGRQENNLPSTCPEIEICLGGDAAQEFDN